MNTRLSTLLIASLGIVHSIPTSACTGITLKSKDGATIAARTIEWEESVIPPRERQQGSLRSA